VEFFNDICHIYASWANKNITEYETRPGKIHVFVCDTKQAYKIHDALETLANGTPCLSEANIRRPLRNEATLKFSGVCRDIRVIVRSCNCELVITFGKRKNLQWATEFTHIKGISCTRARILKKRIRMYMSIKKYSPSYVGRSNTVFKTVHPHHFFSS
jgi:hypothetical protein